MIQNQTFGWHLLLTSTCLVKMLFFDQRNTNYFNQMQVNKLQFGQSNYKLDQISLELILANLNQRDITSFTVAKEQNLKQLGSLNPEKRLYELVKLRLIVKQVFNQLLISFMIVFLIFQLHQL
jgi:hypothetical protein